MSYQQCARFRTTVADFDANISGTDQAIDERKTALATTIFVHARWKQSGEFWSTNKKMTLMF